ncbi:Heparan sulfate 2-O-sulfotransferase 1 [Holothuria leucospilota]|uniref:Heparan sulfate 2-O-sulfotransferase 1 n=1 Tax=Holothuria leucospilota TaxID=206669 RepID=A0A9Q1CGE3_HOLLE|nr:Heparan sulfate 2-O-sulfotransferase 1 [Holothuria leucospilota]
MPSPAERIRHDVTSETSNNGTVIFNVLPKCGSRTLYDLVKKTSFSFNRNVTIRNTMGSYVQSHDDKLREIRKLLFSPGLGFLYTHMRYRDFVTARPKPRYISVVRDPIDRLASLYYFVRYGDNLEEDDSPAAVEFRLRMKRMNYSDETFDECVLKGDKLCQDKGTLIGHFCGYDTHPCKAEVHSKKAFNKAVTNIERNYVVIGIMEDYDSFLRVLEKVLPEYFGGALSIYHQQKKDTLSKMKTKNKTTVSRRTKKILSKQMTAEYKLYNYLKARFERTKKEFGVS